MPSMNSLMHTLTEWGYQGTALPISQRPEQTTTSLDQSTGTAVEATQSARIEISSLGRALSTQSTQTQTARNNEDIESSNLPDEIKRVLEMIRELKAQLQEQQKEMARILADGSLNETEKKNRLEQAQTMINGLSSALMSASGLLGKLMQEQNLDQEQAMQVMTLMAK